MPSQLATAAANTGLAYSPQRKIEQLCDGSYLSLVQTAANTLSLVQVTSPSGTPSFSTLAQTFAFSGGTNTVGDLFILNNGTTTSDVWVTWSDNSASTGLFVAHGTYTASGGTWSWDNTSTSIALGTFTHGFMLPTIVWTGSNLIIAMRANGGNYGVSITYTSTKNGSSGWAAITTLDGGNLGSHCYALVRHDATNGCTLCVYTLANDTVYARVIADASTPSVANWSARATLSGTVGVGAANFSAVLDHANSRLHVVYGNSSVATNPQYNSATYTTTSITPGTSFSVDSGATTFTGASIGLDSASPPNAYVFWATGAVGSASDIEYAKIASPYSSAGSVTNLTNNTANDNAYPHPPVQSAMSGYIPLVYAHAVSPWAIEYDNSITLSTTYTGSATLKGQGKLTAAGNVAGAGAATLPGHGTLTASGLVVITASATLPGHGAFSASLYAPGTGIGDVAVSTKSQTWSGGPAGSPGTETDVTYTDASGSGWAVGLIPTYGGMPISSWYEVDNGTTGANQTSLTTSTSDGALHWLEQNGTGGFAGSEDKPFTLVEQAPTGTAFRRYYKCSFGPDANGFNWVGYACIYPGDPGIIAYRFDCINPGASAITLAGSDGLEMALIGGLEQSDTTWNATNGGYGTLAAGNTTPWPTASATGNPVVANPDYVYITPASGSGVKVGRVTALQKEVSALSPAWATPQLSALVNTSRLKLKVFGDVTSFPASTTSTAYLLWAFRRGLTATDAFAISADYINPGTPSVSAGNFTSFSYDEAAYVCAAAASGARLTATLDFTPAHVTVRYKPRFKITGWTGGTPILTWGGATLTAGSDYRVYNDTSTNTLYLHLYFDVVASGATTGQRTNAALDVLPSVVSASATLTGDGTLTASGVESFKGSATLTGQGSLSAAGVQVVSGAAQLPGHGVLTAQGVQVLTASATLAGHGTLTAQGQTGQAGAATLTGQGALTVSGVQVITASATLAGHGTLTAQGVQVVTASATFTGHGTLTAAAQQVLTASATLAGHGTLRASSSQVVGGAVTFTGRGALSAFGVQVVSKAALLSGQGRLSAAATEVTTGGVAVAVGQGRVLAAGLILISASAVLRGQGRLRASLAPHTGPVGVAITSGASGPRGVSITDG